MYPSYPRNQITALILSGGKGRRMGGLDKGLVNYQGRPLARHVAEALAPQASRLLLSANRSQQAYRNLGMTPLADLRPGYPGPLAGIEAGLAACNTRYLLVCPCDSPHIPADLGPRLWEAMRSQGSQACHASDPARRHYLHLLLRVDQAADLQGFLDAGGRAVRHWLADKQVAEAPFTADELANLNEPDTQRGVCGA